MLLFLFILAFFVRILFAFAAPIKIWDETVYLNLGTDLSHNLLDYSFSHGWSDFIPTSQGEYGYPNAGFRAPLLPYIIAFLHIFHLSSLITYLMPFIGAVSVILVYLLGKELFSKKVGLIAALFFAFVPLHVENSGRVLTDVLLTFFVLLSFLSFWKGFEKGNNNHKILFGIFLALSLLSRYTALWIVPIFILYSLIRGKLLQFLLDKYVWLAILAFFITISPWLLYGLFTYHNPIGPFIHGSIASKYWGGSQTWYHFFIYWWDMFSIIGFALVVSLLFLLYKKQVFKKEVYLLLIWFIFVLGLAISQPHKEERFLLPIVPAMALISALALERYKKPKNKIVFVIVVCLFISLSVIFYKLYTANHNVNTSCYQQVGSKLHELQGDFLIVSENSSLFRYYAQQETVYYPDKITEDTIKDLVNSTGKKVLFVLTSYNSGFDTEKMTNVRQIMNKNYDLIFECPQYKEVNRIYLKADTRDLPNLIPNHSFEADDDSVWITNTSANVGIDDTNKGVEPSPLKSAKMTGSSKEADLHTALIPVEQGALYEFKVFADTKEQKSGELGFLIDEYTEANKWLGATWVGNAIPKTTGYVAGLYTPSSVAAHSIRIHAYVTKESKGTIYLDNYQLYKIN